MSDPGVPGGRVGPLTLPCGESVSVRDLDMGLREYDCPCGDRHAVVTDVHPPSRFLPEYLVRELRTVVDVADDRDRFDTVHLMGMVLEEFPGAVESLDVAGDGQVGYAMVWVTDFDARRLHEVVVELVVEMMDHAVGHADDPGARSQFEDQLEQFDVEAFVDAYREARDFEDEGDRPA